MSIAQRLYEGVGTGEGQVGLITYMRTDSTAMAGVAMAEAQKVIAQTLKIADTRKELQVPIQPLQTWRERGQILEAEHVRAGGDVC